MEYRKHLLVGFRQSIASDYNYWKMDNWQAEPLQHPGSPPPSTSQMQHQEEGPKRKTATSPDKVNSGPILELLRLLVFRVAQGSRNKRAEQRRSFKILHISDFWLNIKQWDMAWLHRPITE